MESVKSEICASLQENFGAGSYVLELDTKDRCIKIELTSVSADHVIYIRPDDRELNFLCHYAHKADLEADLEFDKNGDTLAWKQQNVAQLPRKVKGSLGIFSTVAMWYVRQAAERIDLMKDMGGRRGDCGPVIETIQEARAREFYFPLPMKAEPVVFLEDGGSGAGAVATSTTTAADGKKTMMSKKKKSNSCSSSSNCMVMVRDPKKKRKEDGSNGGGGDTTTTTTSGCNKKNKVVAAVIAAVGGGAFESLPLVKKNKKNNHHTTAAAAATTTTATTTGVDDRSRSSSSSTNNNKSKTKKKVQKKIIQEARGYDIMFSDDEKT